MFGLIKKLFIGLLPSIVGASNHSKCISLNNQKCLTQPTLINMHPNECNQELRYYQFLVKLDRCTENYNNLDEPSSRVYVPNKTEDLNLHVFNTIIRINEFKKLIKHLSCKCECKLVKTVTQN